MKLADYRAVVIPTLLYVCKSWVVYSRHGKDLDRIQRLRSIMRIRWFHYITNEKILSKAKGASFEVLVARARLRWVGHVFRMEVSDEEWEQLVSNRAEWRRVIYTYEGKVPARRSNNRNNTVYECPDCGRRTTSMSCTPTYENIRDDLTECMLVNK